MSDSDRLQLVDREGIADTSGTTLESLHPLSLRQLGLRNSIPSPSFVSLGMKMATVVSPSESNR